MPEVGSESKDVYLVHNFEGQRQSAGSLNCVTWAHGPHRKHTREEVKPEHFRALRSSLTALSLE